MTKTNSDKSICWFFTALVAVSTDCLFYGFGYNRDIDVDTPEFVDAVFRVLLWPVGLFAVVAVVLFIYYWIEDEAEKHGKKVNADLDKDQELLDLRRDNEKLSRRPESCP